MQIVENLENFLNFFSFTSVNYWFSSNFSAGQRFIVRITINLILVFLCDFSETSLTYDGNKPPRKH